MNVKFKLSATVLAMLAFTLLLFYQNCAQQSDELSGSSVETGGGTPTGPYGVTCINQSSNPAHPQANIFNVTISNLGIDAVGCADANSDGRGCASGLPDTTQKAFVPGGGECPPISAAGYCELTTRYLGLYGPWVRMDCPCNKTVKSNFDFKSNINGYMSMPLTTPTGPAGHYNLREFATQVSAIYLYVKKNQPGPFEYSGRNINGAFARCGLVR